MSNRAKYILVILIFCLIAAQVIRPEKTNPSIDLQRTILAQAKAPPDVMGIIERACQDCHSHKTLWPWYSEIAPVSWLLISDVNEGRSHLNFSEWAAYSREKQKDKLQDMCKEIKKGDMPLWYYKPLHPNARLSQADIQTLCAWSDVERRRLP